MAAFNKFYQFVEDLSKKVHDIWNDQLEIYLSNATPSASADAVKADLAEIGTGNGYTGPIDTQQTVARSNGTVTVTGTKITITATPAAINPFQYVVLQNTTPTSPADPLIGWWDYGSALTLNAGDSFTIKFNNGDPTGTIFTLA